MTRRDFYNFSLPTLFGKRTKKTLRKVACETPESTDMKQFLTF
ncbi:hypothetical protein D925_02663 [Enterococcus faecalis B83616-1]|nr:hypothetical protein D925_02663 [Enterococcus faecalis B83616-1]